MKIYNLNKTVILVALLSVILFPINSFAQKEDSEIPAEVTSLEELIKSGKIDPGAAKAGH